MKKLSKRDKRALVIVAAVVVLYVVVFHVIMPFYDAGSAVQTKLDLKKRMLQSAVRTIQKKEVYASEVNEIDKVLGEYSQRLLDAPDAPTAATQLDDIVRNLANENKVTLTKSNPLQERKVGEKYTKVTIQINLDADLASTTAFLYALSIHPKFLLVEDFSVSKFRLQQQLQPRMNVSAFIRLS